MGSESESEGVVSFRAWQLPSLSRPVLVDPSPSIWQFGPWAPLRVLCAWAGALAGLSLPEPVVQMAAVASQAPSPNLGFQTPP